MNSFLCFSLLPCCVLVVVAPSFGGEPPQIDRLSPPGMQRGVTTEIKLVGKPGDGPLQVWSESNAVEFIFSEDQSSATVTSAEGIAPGLHRLRFFNQFGATDLLPFLVGVIPEVAEQEPNNDIASAQLIDQPSVTLNGALEKNGDVDTCAVTLTAGKKLIASMQANRELGSPMDAVLQVLDAHGTVLAQNDDDHDIDPQIVIDVPADGQYFVRTFAFPSTPNSSIRLAGGADYVYRLTLTSEGYISHVSPAVVDRRIENSLTLHGWNLTSNTAALPPFENDDSVLHHGFANVLNVNGVQRDCFAEERLADTPLPVPHSVTGYIAVPGESDVYQIVGEKGQKLSLQVVARTLYSLLDPVCVVTDATGKVVKDADDKDRSNLDVQTEFSLGDGVHNITITDRYGHGGERFFYVMTCESIQPEFSASIKDNALVIVEAATVDLRVTIERRHGFSEKLIVSVNGLPEGLTCDPVESLNDGETAKLVTLKWTRSETAPAFSGPVRINCMSESGEGRFARVSIKNSSETTDQIWLTIPPQVTPTEQAK